MGLIFSLYFHYEWGRGRWRLLICSYFGLIFFSVHHPSLCLKVKWWVIIIIIRLRSRRLQIFSKNSDLKLERQLHLEADRFLYPQAASGCRICSLSFVTLVSFCHELKHEDIIFCMVHHLASCGCARRNADGSVLQCR